MVARPKWRLSRVVRSVWQPLASAAETSRAVHHDAATAAAVRTLLAGAAGRVPRGVPPWQGFAAQTLLGAQLRRHSAAPLAARLLHSTPPGRDSSQQQQQQGRGADVPLRDAHSAALATAKDDAPAPEREVRGAATRTCSRLGACAPNRSRL